MYYIGRCMPSRSWTTHMVGRCRELHVIIAFGQYTLTNDIGCGMLSLPLDNRNGRTTLGVHAIIAIGQYTQPDDVGRGLPSSPLGSTHGRMTSGVTCYHCTWKENTIVRHRAWHAIIYLGQHIRSNDVGCGMPLSLLDCTHT